MEDCYAVLKIVEGVRSVVVESLCFLQQRVEGFGIDGELLEELVVFKHVLREGLEFAFWLDQKVKIRLHEKSDSFFFDSIECSG